jgi:RNA polymerase sigma factor (sigma-70 family)
METTARTRPSRAEIEPAALDLIRRHSGQIMSTARRHSATPEDAEDAYQRGLEILLTKAPTTHEDDLLPWVKTVVKHEAYAVRRQRLRTPPVSAICDGDAAEAEPLAPGSADEEAERYDRLRLGAEAMGRLKPQEVRALLLKAEGLTYKEIQEETGWTYTKVNRCITEGRRAFVARVQGIESGAECERVAPLLSALADGEASAEDMAALRPHLRGCLSCRATLREYREVPARAAALVPAAALAGGGGGGSFLGWLHAHAAHTVMRAHGVFEAVSGSKAAAVAGATAALAGGGVAAVHELGPAHHRPRHTQVRLHAPQRHAAPVRVATPERRVAPAKPRRRPNTAVRSTPVAVPDAPLRRDRPSDLIAPKPASKPEQPRATSGKPGEFAP